jgi:hypothetical protein
MQIGRETILRRWNRIEQHDCADLSAMTYAVGDHMPSISSRDMARSAVRERKVDPFRQLVAIKCRHIVEIL